MRKGHLFIISGPSAVGKTVVADKIFEMDSEISKIVTYTTRKRRESEKDGEDYNFVSQKEFLKLEKEGQFIESSLVYGNYYGVRLSFITEKMEQGQDLLLLINWEGFQKIKKKIVDRVYGFFLMPPSMEELERRIKLRAADSDEVIQQRLKMAAEDMRHASEFDVCIENVDIQDTAEKILKRINEIKLKM